MSSTADSWLSDAELLVPGLSRIVRAVWKSSLRIDAFRGASSRRRWWPEKSFRSSSACWVSRMRFCASWSCRESACIEIWRGKTGRQAYKQAKSARGRQGNVLGASSILTLPSAHFSMLSRGRSARYIAVVFHQNGTPSRSTTSQNDKTT